VQDPRPVLPSLARRCFAQVAQQHAAALAEDASVFDYDGVYDELQAQRAAPKQAEKLARKSRYIEGLLDKAKEREREQDIVYERKCGFGACSGRPYAATVKSRLAQLFVCVRVGSVWKARQQCSERGSDQAVGAKQRVSTSCVCTSSSSEHGTCTA
jgi:hypothetical protein